MMRLTYRSVTPSSFAISEVDGAAPVKSFSFHLYALVSALISVALGRGSSSCRCPGGITRRISPEHSFSRAGTRRVNASPLAGSHMTSHITKPAAAAVGAIETRLQFQFGCLFQEAGPRPPSLTVPFVPR